MKLPQRRCTSMGGDVPGFVERADEANAAMNLCFHQHNATCVGRERPFYEGHQNISARNCTLAHKGEMLQLYPNLWYEVYNNKMTASCLRKSNGPSARGFKTG